MNNLPNDVIQTIYFYEQKLEFVEVMNQLLQAKMKVYFSLSLKQCRFMYSVRAYITYSSLNVNDVKVTPIQLLNVIIYYKFSFH